MYHFVRAPLVNMHVCPDLMSEVDSQAIYATSVKIVEDNGNWKKIETPDGYQGWMPADVLYASTYLYPASAKEAKIKTLRAHIYWVPDTRPHPPLLTLPFDARIEVLIPEDYVQRWWKVILVDGSQGWIQKGDIELHPKQLSLSETMELSTLFIGLPYTWGGVSSFGFDCSGFAQRLYKQMGIALPRNSSLQARDARGVEIPRESLQSGDLLFFGMNQRVSHVGIYLENDRFIHAKAHLKEGSPILQIHSLKEPKWEEPYLFAKRFVTNG